MERRPTARRHPLSTPGTARPRVVPLPPLPPKPPSRPTRTAPPERVFRPNALWQAAFLTVALICFGIAFACFSPYLHCPVRTASLYAVVALFTAGARRRLRRPASRRHKVFGLLGLPRLCPSRTAHCGLLGGDTVGDSRPGPAFRIAVGKGQILSLNGHVWEFFTLAKLIEVRTALSQLPTLLETLEAGHRVSFGPLSADKTGIYCREHAVPWLRLLSLSLGLEYKEPNWRTRIRKGLFLRINHDIQVKMEEIRNYRLFETMVLYHQPACQVQPLAC